MAEKYRFMDSVQLEDGTYEEEYEYDAQDFTDYFKALVTTGLMKSAGNQLAVTVNGTNMVSKIDTGIAFLLGRYYENDSFKELTHDTETLGNSRIDRIVIRMDLSTEARYVKSFIKKGVPSTNPVAPTLTQTPNLYEISLAQVKIVGGQTFIATNAVTDERGKDIICPWAGSNILPNFDNNQVLELINKKANVELETPIPITFNSGYAKRPELDVITPCFYKDNYGVVHVLGLVNKLIGAGTVMTTLPVGYRPARRQRFTDTGLLTVASNGDIISYHNNSSSGTFFVIDISFRSDEKTGDI